MERLGILIFGDNAKKYIQLLNNLFSLLKNLLLEQIAGKFKFFW